MNISEDIEIPFQCYFFDNDRPFESNPETCTHILIPKELNSHNCYSTIPIDIPLEDVKNETLKQILLTLETEGKRKIQDEKQLKLFCLQRTINTFSEHCPLETTVINEEEVTRLNNENLKCYACLDSFKINNTIVYHPLDKSIVIHNNCLTEFND
jgi:hypothetical protein